MLGLLATTGVGSKRGTIDEHQAAVIEGNRPPQARIGDVLGADVDAVSGVVAEVIDDGSGAFDPATREDAHPIADREVGCRGRIGDGICIFGALMVQANPSPNLRSR
jgi:hypothetical protein